MRAIKFVSALILAGLLCSCMMPVKIESVDDINFFHALYHPYISTLDIDSCQITDNVGGKMRKESHSLSTVSCQALLPIGEFIRKDVISSREIIITTADKKTVYTKYTYYPPDDIKTRIVVDGAVVSNDRAKLSSLFKAH